MASFWSGLLSKMFVPLAGQPGVAVLPILDDGADGGCNAPGDKTNGMWVNVKSAVLATTDALLTSILARMPSRSDGTLTALISAAALPGSGAFTTTAYAAVPAGTRRVTFVVAYAKHASATTGQCKKRIQWKFSDTVTDVFDGYLDTGALTVAEPKVSVKGYCEDILGPIFNAGTTSGKHQWTFEVPAGAIGVALQLAEVADTTNMGTVSQWVITSEAL